MSVTRKNRGSGKRLSTFKTLMSTLNPNAIPFSPKKKNQRLPIFKLLSSGLSPATKILLKKNNITKTSHILEQAKKIKLNANAKIFTPKKGKGKGKGKRKGKGKGKITRRQRKGH